MRYVTHVKNNVSKIVGFFVSGWVGRRFGFPLLAQMATRTECR